MPVLTTYTPSAGGLGGLDVALPPRQLEAWTLFDSLDADRDHLALRWHS